MFNEDKGKVNTHDQSDLLGMKPFGNIGSDRTTKETRVINKLKKKKAAQLRAKGSTFKEGLEANAGKVSAAIGNFANK
jgi:hypothetical protein